MNEDNPGAADAAAARNHGKPSAMSYAGFWRRLLAFEVDFVLSAVVASAMSASAISVTGLTGASRLLATTALMLSLQWFYFAGLEASSWRATIGKRLLGLRVTDVEGRRIGFWRASLRFWAKGVSFAVCLAGFAMIGLTRKRRGLHDFVAGCLVMRKSGALPLPPRLERIEVPLVAVTAMVVGMFLSHGASLLMEPQLRTLSGRLTIAVAMNAIGPAMEQIGQEIAATSKPPAQLGGGVIRADALPPGSQVTYLAPTGGLSVSFSLPPLAGQGLLMTPLRQAEGGVRWLCSAPRLDPEFAPDGCGAGK